MKPEWQFKVLRVTSNHSNSVSKEIERQLTDCSPRDWRLYPLAIRSLLYGRSGLAALCGFGALEALVCAALLGGLDHFLLFSLGMWCVDGDEVDEAMSLLIGG